MPLTHSIKAKADVTMPVYIAVLLSSRPKDSTILKAYGKMDMKAMGSQIRQSATSVSRLVVMADADLHSPRTAICRVGKGVLPLPVAERLPRRAIGAAVWL